MAKSESMQKVKVKGQCHRGQSKFSPVWAFPDLNSYLNSQMATKDAHSPKEHRRGVLLFFKVICQISRSHRIKNH